MRHVAVTASIIGLSMLAACEESGPADPPSTYELDVTIAGEGSGSVTSSPAGIACGDECEADFEEGETVTLTATAEPGSEFEGWTGGGCSGTGACEITIEDATAVTATFSPSSHVLTVDLAGAGDGTVSSNVEGIECGVDCTEEFAHETIILLTALPETGSEFEGWTGGGCSGTGPCEVTIEDATAVTATFSLSSYLLTVDVTGAGAGIVSSDVEGIECGVDCTEEFAHGTVILLTALPDDGFAFVGWDAVGCTGTGACAVTMTGETSVSATFGVLVAAWPDSPTSFCKQDDVEVPCPNGYAGQDGHYEIRVPTYTTAGGRLHDSVTGLTWEWMPPYTPLAKADAITYCGDLQLDGFGDWRVPSRLELASILDTGQRGMPFNGTVFPDIPGNSYFWSRNANPGDPTRSWVINTNWAVLGFRDNTEVENSPGDGNLVRCVRGPALMNDLSAVGSTVVDAGTGLVWQSATAPALTDWTDALAYCESLVLDSQNDWRLPSIKEWFSIIDDTLVATPRISVLFAERPTLGPDAFFWSSTFLPRDGDPETYVLNTSTGVSVGIGNDIDLMRNVRCVR